MHITPTITHTCQQLKLQTSYHTHTDKNAHKYAYLHAAEGLLECCQIFYCGLLLISTQALTLAEGISTKESTVHFKGNCSMRYVLLTDMTIFKSSMSSISVRKTV